MIEKKEILWKLVAASVLFSFYLIGTGIKANKPNALMVGKIGIGSDIVGGTIAGGIVWYRCKKGRKR